VFSEYDYNMQNAALATGLPPRDCRIFMVADRRWKLIQPVGFRPMLFDLESDPDEFCDLGCDPRLQNQRDRLGNALAAWGLRLSQRTTRSEQEMIGMRGRPERRGVLIGLWDEQEVSDELWAHYSGKSG
jgi:hypothetical protein